jgi:hypothetical protein
MMAFMVLPTIGFAQQNVLVGTWYVRCPKGHDDKVDCLTGNHMCEKCFSVAVTDGKAKVVCPKGHPNSVSGLTQSKKCSVCGKECRRDTSFKVYDPNKDFAKLQDELKKKGC